MGDRKDWGFKQLVTQAEMDDAQDLVELEFGMMLGRIMGKRFHGTTIGTTEDPDGSEPGSIIGGGVVAPFATTTVEVSYLTALVPTERVADFPVRLDLRETDLSATAWAPMIATMGDPRGTQTRETFNFNTIIAAITASMFVKCRIYARLLRVETDPRIDGNGVPFNFNRAVGQLVIEVDTGAEAASQGAAVAPTLRADKDSVHLAVLELDDTVTTITTAMIFHKDRRHNGWTPYGHDGRGPVQVISYEDTTTGLATATKGELIQTVSHGFNYDGHVTVLPAFDSGTIETRRGIFGAFAAEGNGVADELCGLRRDYILCEQTFMVFGETANDIVSGVGILPLGMTDATEAFSLTEDDVDFRARYANDSGENITIHMFTKLFIFDRRSWNDWLL